MSILAWAILLLVAGVLILILEFFVPSSGVLGVLATIAIIGAVWLGFMHSFRSGTILLLISVVVVPFVLLGAIKFWPETPIGRRMLIQPPTDDEIHPVDDPVRQLANLIGKKGRARTEMLPGGSVEVDGRRFDAVSDSGAIEPGTPIYVVRLETRRLVVRIDDAPIPASLASPIDPAQLATPSKPAEHIAQEKTAPDQSKSLVSSPFDEPLI